MYTLEELWDKTFKELKALGYQLNALPDGDKRRRQNWIDAIAGVNPPLLALLEESAPADSDSSGAIEVQRIEPIQTSPGVEAEQRQGSIETSPGVEAEQRQGSIETSPGVEAEQHQGSIETSPGVEPVSEPIQTSPGVEVEQRQGSIETSPGVEAEQRQGSIESKFGRIFYPRAGSKSIAQLPKTSPGVEDIQGQNHAEPNGIGTEQNGTDEIAIGSGIHQQCLNTAQPDGISSGFETETPRSQKGDRVLARARDSERDWGRPLSRKPDELTALFSDDRPPNRGDNGRDRLESEPKLSQSAIEPVVGSSQECRSLEIFNSPSAFGSV